ncbi:Ig-like domain-containing protein [Candidatus Berkelbacteria bacterium]|nr:Ig-like domain-containing protein [Candidatus Berkelbacteria bacterium]
MDKATFNLEPEVPVKLKFGEENNILIAEAENCFAQQQNYQVTVTTSVPIDDALDQELVNNKYRPFTYQKTFTTQPAPATSLTKPNSVARVDINSIDINFSEPMNQDEVLGLIKLSPDLAGNWLWVDEQNLSFQLSQQLNYNQTYKIQLSGRAKSIDGSYIDSFDLAFRTYGAVSVSKFSPYNGQVQVPINKEISINFNQPVDHPSAEDAFTISPPIAGNFEWQANTLIFKTSGLAQDTTYTVAVDQGIGSINGLASTRSYSTTFTTIESQTILNVPYDRQDYPLSCEASALKMALGFYGLNPSEDEIIARVGYNGPVHRNQETNIWGNPNIGYVGDISGSQNTTGYGVHWGPIAKAASSYRSTQAFSGWSATQLAAELETGHPVVIWGSIGGSPDSWQDESGNTIFAWKGEHTWTVIGFTGKVDNPTGFYTHNPLGPANQRWSISSFMGNWAKFGNSGVVVR